MMSDDKLAGAEGVAPLSQALPGFNVAPRLYLAAPAGTPPAIVVKLEEAVRIALAKSAVVHGAAAQGAVPAPMRADALKADLARESADWAKLIKAQKISEGIIDTAGGPVEIGVHHIDIQFMRKRIPEKVRVPSGDPGKRMPKRSMVHDKEICPAGDGVLHNAKRCIQSTCDGINDFLSFHDQTYSSFIEFFCEGGGGNFLEQSNRTGQLHTTEIDGEGRCYFCKTGVSPARGALV